MRVRALKAMVILVSTCVLGCGDEKPRSDSSRRTVDPSGAHYVNVRQFDELTAQACQCRSAGCADKVRTMAKAFLSDSERGALPANAKFEKCLKAASKATSVPLINAHSAQLQLEEMVQILCDCETLACSQKADIELGRVSDGMKHLKVSRLSESEKESLDQLAERAESCRVKHLEPGTPAMALEHFKAYADEVCACTDRKSLAAVKKKFSGSGKRFSHLKREDFGGMWEEGAKHSERANECRMAIELQPRRSP